MEGLVTTVELIGKERDRLLQSTARLIGIAGTSLSLVSLSIPGIVPVETYLGILPPLSLLLLVQLLIGSGANRALVIVGVLSGLAVQSIALLPLDVSSAPGLARALAPLAGAGIGSLVLVTQTRPGRVLMLFAAVASVTLVEFATPTPGQLSFATISVLLGWVLCAVLRYWLTASVPQAARRIDSIGTAHQAERIASETEAQRRQSARLLHDTVLATLTLLAHSGVGVTPQAMREQAAGDARLLRQLRLGATPNPQSSGGYTLDRAVQLNLGTTLESVQQRFSRIGLEVSWHGTGDLPLTEDSLDAFLLALSECLENVRRHSGVTNAQVAISTDETTLRATVTDAGCGFDVSAVPDDKLGYRDSIVGRLREVGGNARVFSSPGAGTTVVLEVPR